MTFDNCFPAEDSVYYTNRKLKSCTHLLGDLVKKQGQSQSDHPNTSVGDPAAPQPVSHIEGEGGLLLSVQAPLDEGVLMLQGC